MMAHRPLPLVQGTLDLIVLRTLASGPCHGFGIATEVHGATDGRLLIEDAALYQALHRLERQGCVEAEWRASENNRRARYYRLTPEGRKRLAQQADQWRQYARALDALLKGV
jgi:PadR family transcriptional regulator PadR